MITSDATPDRVEVLTEIRASCERVFDALVDPNELARWWGDAHMYHTQWKVDLQPGANMSAARRRSTAAR